MEIIDSVEISPGKWVKKTPKTAAQANIRKGIEKIKETFGKMKTGGTSSPNVSTVDRIKKIFNNIKGKANSGSQSTQATFSINGKNFVTDTNGKNSTTFDRIKSRLNYVKEKFKTGGKSSPNVSTTDRIKNGINQFKETIKNRFNKSGSSSSTVTGGKSSSSVSTAERIKNGFNRFKDTIKNKFVKTGGKQTTKTGIRSTIGKGIKNIGGKIFKGVKTVGKTGVKYAAKGAKFAAGKAWGLACAHPIGAAVVISAVVGSAVGQLIVSGQTKEFKADAAKNDDNISRLKADIEFLQRLKRNADGDNQ